MKKMNSQRKVSTFVIALLMVRARLYGLAYFVNGYTRVVFSIWILFFLFQERGLDTVDVRSLRWPHLCFLELEDVHRARATGRGGHHRIYITMLDESGYKKYLVRTLLESVMKDYPKETEEVLQAL